MQNDPLDTLIEKLRALKREAASQPIYEIMSGSLVWPGEIPSGLTMDEMTLMKIILHYRTSLISNALVSIDQDLWDKFRAKYPDWIGFDSSRCQANERLSKLYHHHRKVTKRYINKIP